jgi:hypothetical protein
MFGHYKRADFSIAIKRRGKPPSPWRWEIYRAGQSSPVAVSSEFFASMADATKVGKQALVDLLEKHLVRE